MELWNRWLTPAAMNDVYRGKGLIYIVTLPAKKKSLGLFLRFLCHDIFRARLALDLFHTFAIRYGIDQIGKIALHGRDYFLRSAHTVF